MPKAAKALPAVTWGDRQMNRILTLTSFAALAACSGGLELPDLRSGGEAEAPDVMEAPTAALTAKERFIAAVEAEGCVLDANTINAVLANAQLSASDLAAAAGELEAEGRAVGNQAAGTIRVISPNCPAV